VKRINFIFIFFLSSFLFSTSFSLPINKSGDEINRANMDTTINPAVDFYDYANGNWIKNNPIPAEYPRWGSFTILIENNFDKLKNASGELPFENAFNVPEDENIFHLDLEGKPVFDLPAEQHVTEVPSDNVGTHALLIGGRADLEQHDWEGQNGDEI